MIKKINHKKLLYNQITNFLLDKILKNLQIEQTKIQLLKEKINSKKVLTLH